MKQPNHEPFRDEFIKTPLQASGYYEKYLDITLGYHPKKFVLKRLSWYQRLGGYSSDEAGDFIEKKDLQGFVDIDQRSIFLRNPSLEVELHEFGHLFAEGQDPRKKLVFLPFEQDYMTNIMHEGLAEWLSFYISKLAKNVDLKREVQISSKRLLNPFYASSPIDKEYLEAAYDDIKNRFKYRKDEKEIPGMEPSEYSIGFTWAIHHLGILTKKGLPPKNAIQELLNIFPRQLAALEESVRDITTTSFQ